MDGKEFVSSIRKFLMPESISGCMKQLEKPNKLSSADELGASTWYKRLSSEEQSIVRGIVTRAVHSTLFGILVVLDNCDTIEEGEGGGGFELYYSKEGTRVQLNGQTDDLHDML
ncbi:hypothetical protein SAMN05216289_1782 [Dokdonella immobilis]|uniref:Uncharacterized protein n=2 Tax=Dokdonella immobilis TaxID=578942 RepID=A0A1I5BF87_9GAMM|nr:hypothetical protein SAMN05216289_1782 [Dokdonella immobilis]